MTFPPKPTRQDIIATFARDRTATPAILAAWVKLVDEVYDDGLSVALQQASGVFGCKLCGSTCWKTSVICRGCGVIWVNPLKESAANRLVALAHEVGHHRDKATPDDFLLVRGTREHKERTLEREITAWDTAEAILRPDPCWDEVQSAFETQRSEGEKGYRTQLAMM
jgi:hypothetical protein